MVLRNFWIVPGAWIKLCRYAANPQKYSELEKYRHIQYILRRAVEGGNINLKVSGTENIPQDGGFMFYANHQGMFDVLAIAVTCDRPVGAVLKKELYNIPFIHQVALCTQSYAMDRGGCPPVPDGDPAGYRGGQKGQSLPDFPRGNPEPSGQPDAGISMAAVSAAPPRVSAPLCPLP